MTRAEKPDPRRGLLAKIHAGAKALGLDDDTRRAKMAALTGKDSCKAMSVAELEQVARALSAPAAAQPLRKRFRHGPRTGPAAKATALWIDLADRGAVADRTDAALAAFITRQTGQDLGTLEPAQWTAVIQALTAWRDRAALTPDRPRP